MRTAGKRKSSLLLAVFPRLKWKIQFRSSLSSDVVFHTDVNCCLGFSVGFGGRGRRRKHKNKANLEFPSESSTPVTHKIKSKRIPSTSVSGYAEASTSPEMLRLRCLSCFEGHPLSHCEKVAPPSTERGQEREKEA
ncbi:hypothetical protein SAY86_006437 [Trapa natans]|uniref:Uncharacterized protein n=1 Tax=Trapa natans TaxID=22666 RepID=A0AAN7QTB0_TRANT|nr:hypothetical protein SAY86_006437 [Trapa natans]